MVFSLMRLLPVVLPLLFTLGCAARRTFARREESVDPSAVCRDAAHRLHLLEPTGEWSPIVRPTEQSTRLEFGTPVTDFEGDPKAPDLHQDLPMIEILQQGCED